MYPDQWRSLWSIRQLTRRWARSGIISEEQHDRIDAHFEQPFRTVHLMLAIATAIFTVIVAVALLVLIFEITDADEYPLVSAFICAVLSAFYWFVAKLVTEFHGQMHTGIDDGMSLALVFSVFMALISLGMLGTEPSDLEARIYFCIAAAIGALVFRTLLSAFVFLLGVTVVVLQVILNEIRLQPAASMVALLLTVLVLEAMLLASFNRFRENWRSQLEKVEYALLGGIVVFSNYAVIFYLAPDYTPVTGDPLPPGEDGIVEINLASLSFLYYLITVSIPFLMIYVGFAITNVRMLRIGTVGILLAITTLRFHFFTDALEAFLIIGGLLLVGFVLIAQRILRNGFGRYINHPLLSEEHEDLNLEDMLLNRGTLAIQNGISRSGSAR